MVIFCKPNWTIGLFGYALFHIWQHYYFLKMYFSNIYLFNLSFNIRCCELLLIYIVPYFRHCSFISVTSFGLWHLGKKFSESRVISKIKLRIVQVTANNYITNYNSQSSEMPWYNNNIFLRLTMYHYSIFGIITVNISYLLVMTNTKRQKCDPKLIKSICLVFKIKIFTFSKHKLSNIVH